MYTLPRYTINPFSKEQMKTRYVIARANNADQLTEMVQAKLDEGWTLQGAVSVTYADSIIFTQTLISVV